MFVGVNVPEVYQVQIEPPPRVGLRVPAVLSAVEGWNRGVAIVRLVEDKGGSRLAHPDRVLWRLEVFAQSNARGVIGSAIEAVLSVPLGVPGHRGGVINDAAQQAIKRSTYIPSVVGVVAAVQIAVVVVDLVVGNRVP